MLQNRKKHIAELDETILSMKLRNAGRKPDWDAEQLMLLDRTALELGKRCVLWDDAGSGFYLVSIRIITTMMYELNVTMCELVSMQMINWDWVRNCPAGTPTPDATCELGWWANAKQLLSPPLLDSSIPDSKVAAWLEAHTMAVHHQLLAKLDKIRRRRVKQEEEVEEEETTRGFVMEDEYWEQLQQLPRCC